MCIRDSHDAGVENVHPACGGAALGGILGQSGQESVLDAVSYTHLDVYKRQVYDETPADPPDTAVDRMCALCWEKRCQAVIAVGGGSCIDSGKCVAFIANTQQMESSESVQLPPPA